MPVKLLTDFNAFAVVTKANNNENLAHDRPSLPLHPLCLEETGNDL
jgi:hypothetical protein